MFRFSVSVVLVTLNDNDGRVSCSEQTEATEVFFSVTKLFQSKDIGLRRMVYLMIKEISPSNDEVFSLATGTYQEGSLCKLPLQHLGFSISYRACSGASVIYCLLFIHSSV